MDASANRPPTSTSSSSSSFSSSSSESGSTPAPVPIYTAAPHDKLIRHKLFLLTCEKLAELGRSVGSQVFRRKIGMLTVCRKTKDNNFRGSTDECSNLLTDRDINPVAGPLFTRRSSRTPVPPPVKATPPPEQSTPMLIGAHPRQSYLSFTPLMAVSPIMEPTIRLHEYREKPTVVPDIIPSSPPRSPWSFNFEHIIEYAARDDSITMIKASDSDAESDSDIEDAADAFDVFFMDEDSSSFTARKRKSRRSEDVAEKRHCDDASQGSPMALSAPIPIPQPHKKPDYVLDTLVPLRGFFIESR
uniref:Ski_Sno domain-containing protein n=1 Tax=Panagrellus redivivus TaxID=6233 RepID=A0A7E4ZUD7_PANRE